jgi:hypothetical protein
VPRCRSISIRLCSKRTRSPADSEPDMRNEPMLLDRSDQDHLKMPPGCTLPRLPHSTDTVQFLRSLQSPPPRPRPYALPSLADAPRKLESPSLRISSPDLTRNRADCSFLPVSPVASWISRLLPKKLGGIGSPLLRFSKHAACAASPGNASAFASAFARAPDGLAER